MQAITVYDKPSSNSGCVQCCCETVSLKPGSIEPLFLNYAPWAVPIAPRGLHCEPSVHIEEQDTCPPQAGNNMPPRITSADGMVRFDTGKNVHLDGDLRTKVTDLEGAVVEYKLLPHHGPKHGKLVLNKSGQFGYDPHWNYFGEERFYCSASDGINPPFVFEVMIAVDIDAGTMVPAPVLGVGKPIVDQRYYTVKLPLIASPAARECQVFRLTVQQSALDCDCQCYTHVDCVDVRIAKC